MIVYEHSVASLLIWISAAAAILVAAVSYWLFVSRNWRMVVMALLRALFVALLAWCLFFLADGHLWVIRGVGFSLALVPPGQLQTAADPDAVWRVIKLTSALFAVAVSLAMPSMVVQVLVDGCSGWLQRLLPGIGP